MKKCLKVSLIYAVAALAGGVFYREFTKFNNYLGETALSRVHTHLFVLGMFVFLIAALFSKDIRLDSQKTFKAFMVIYNIGVPLTSVMLAVRGVTQVLGTELSKGADASISGIAGIAHILVGAGIVLFLVALLKCSNLRKVSNKN